jgi:hypothetical protein
MAAMSPLLRRCSAAPACHDWFVAEADIWVLLTPGGRVVATHVSVISKK